MFQLFTPHTKVQKDRQVMRDTDARVAKYSRRGLILNFLVFILSLAFGDFYQREQTLAIVLVVGLLLVTLLRAYYLFRFDALYSRAPGRWRNQYFAASFLGAAWWSVILVSLTWVQGMRDETLVMWLYSVVFYSSVANVFAPYRRFLTGYLFIGQVPAAITAMLLGYAEGYLYGSIMLVFFLMLSHQAKVTALTYWERLEANHALSERAKGLENQQRSSQAAIELKNEFLVNLGHEFRSSLNDILGTLALVDESRLSERERELLVMASKAGERQLDLVNNVVDFSKITTKSLELDETAFDLRRQLEKLIQDFALEAHQQGVELNYLFDPELPERVRGDATRLGQILSILLSHTLKFNATGDVFVEAVFNQEQADSGELQIVISNTERRTRRRDEVATSEARTLDEKLMGIGLSISKGLAECMGGSVHMLENPGMGKRIVINIALQVVSHEAKVLGGEARLRGKRVLLVDLPENVAQDIADEITGWGMDAMSVTGAEQALERLRVASMNDKPIDLMLIYNKLNSFNGLALSKEIAGSRDFSEIRQIIAMSVLQRDTPEVKTHLRTHPQVSTIEKPIMRKRLHDALVQRLLNLGGTDDERPADDLEHKSTGRRILLVEDNRVNQMMVSGMLKKLGCYVQFAHNGREAVATLEREKFDLVLMDCDMPEQDGISATEQIRASEKAESGGKRHTPIVALTNLTTEEDRVRCLNAGMDDHMAKPIRFDDLEARLRQWLGHAANQEKVAQIGQ